MSSQHDLRDTRTGPWELRGSTWTLDENQHESFGLDIPPREEERRSPRLAEEDYEHPYPNRESHWLKRRRVNPDEQELRFFEEAIGCFRGRTEEEYVGEPKYLFGVYEDGVSLGKEQ